MLTSRNRPTQDPGGGGGSSTPATRGEGNNGGRDRVVSEAFAPRGTPTSTPRGFHELKSEDSSKPDFKVSIIGKARLPS
uniref:Uncharacterized protein n=1 Tax=Oryza nivara TaxID=4536 RepID=A0A0E0GK34_ORYNI